MPSVTGKKIFLTGGAGFIGSSMTAALVSRSADVIVYDNLSSGKLEFLKPFMKKKNFKFIKGDLLDRRHLSKVLKSNDIDLVIHMAANPDVALGTKRTDLDLNQGTIATYNIVDEARKNDIGSIMFSSSSVVYGIPRIRPTPEDYGPLLPISLYGASKLASEGLITAYSHLYGIDHYIYRFANVVGVNLTHGVILDFVNKLKKNRRELEVLGNGKQRKSYIDVVDCVNAMLHIYSKSRASGNLYNLATEGQTSASDIANMVIAKVSPAARIRYTGGSQGWPGDIANTYLSNKKMLDAGVKLSFKKSIDAVRNGINVCPNAPA